MAIRAGVGTSENTDPFQAGKEAAAKLCLNAQEDFFDLLLVFASAKFDPQKLLAGIRSVSPDIPLIGCSSAGEITSRGVSSSSLAIMGIKSDSLRFATGLGCGLKADARAAGHHCAQEAIKTRLSNRHVFIMFPDGLTANGADLIRGAQEVLGTSFPIVGGSSGDDFLFEKTYQYYRNQAYSDAVAGILLGGDALLGIGTRHGWHAIGKEHRVSRARGNIIEKLDGKQAIKLYRDYFGEQAEDLRKLSWAKIGTIYPLGMAIPDERENLIRYAFKATEAGSLVCAAEVPEGSLVRLMIADKEGVLTAAREAALEAKAALKGAKIKAAIIFDSVARKRILGRLAKEEINVIKKALGEPCPIIGFYSYGEQAPLRAQRYIGKSYFHNETVVVLCLAENHTRGK
ncbi:MAG: FIST C-terminal domain-containing protein [Candidatus Omnitrophica bacterium]|nr:FIST C-terminal domain-containing protein [Candidatus Omnitrophota bacterium]